jgi:hypothetical protein
MADFVSAALSVARLAAEAKRIDVELHGVDQAVPSYEGRLFLGNPDAGRDTELTEESGYLGSFFVFGKVECWGEDEGHCNPASERKFDRRRPPGRHAKIRVTVPADRARRLAASAGERATLAIVAVTPEVQDSPAAGDLLRFSRLSLIAYG